MTNISTTPAQGERQLLLVRYGELGLKGKNKNIFINRLANNIRAGLKGLQGAQVRSTWGRLWVEVDAVQTESAIERLQQVFGIYSISPVLQTAAEVGEMSKAAYSILITALPAGGSFKIETRRSDKSFPLTSPEISRAVAELLFAELDKLENSPWDADMHRPELTIDIEVREEGTYVYGQTISCAGGLPVNSSGRAMLMLSGGIDSPVAGWMAMKRGVAIEAVYYHSFPFTGEKAKEKVFELCKVLARWKGSHVNLHVVHFTEIQKAIYANCSEEYGITIMRRFMFRIAEKIAKQRRCLAIYTGESVGQVASQTLESMSVINQVIDMPVLRPLVGMDKEEIMERAKKIGSYEISILPFQDCCTVFLPKYPKIRPLLSDAERFEQELDIDALIDEALAQTEMFSFD